MNTELSSFLTQLQSRIKNEVRPRFEDEEWPALIERISVPGRIVEIGRETYGYFVEVLPPKHQLGSLFAFAEGAEALRLFWRVANRYFCRQLTWDETATFCRLAQIPLPH
ncbi:MAG: hypothetical protein FJ303_12725 [Planctomycetes bacterium]|nr:hypothetical protein [Planctomycetota bacterium]